MHFFTFLLYFSKKTKKVAIFTMDSLLSVFLDDGLIVIPHRQQVDFV